MHPCRSLLQPQKDTFPFRRLQVLWWLSLEAKKTLVPSETIVESNCNYYLTTADVARSSVLAEFGVMPEIVALHRFIPSIINSANEKLWFVQLSLYPMVTLGLPWYLESALPPPRSSELLITRDEATLAYVLHIESLAVTALKDYPGMRVNHIHFNELLSPAGATEALGRLGLATNSTCLQQQLQNRHSFRWDIAFTPIFQLPASDYEWKGFQCLVTSRKPWTCLSPESTEHSEGFNQPSSPGPLSSLTPSIECFKILHHWVMLAKYWQRHNLAHHSVATRIPRLSTHSNGKLRKCLAAYLISTALREPPCP